MNTDGKICTSNNNNEIPEVSVRNLAVEARPTGGRNGRLDNPTGNCGEYKLYLCEKSDIRNFLSTT